MHAATRKVYLAVFKKKEIYQNEAVRSDGACRILIRDRFFNTAVLKDTGTYLMTSQEKKQLKQWRNNGYSRSKFKAYR